MERIHIVGGGLAGLIAAIECAEQGAPVRLYEQAPRLGGRARTGRGPYRTNFGPHALYRAGALERWLAARALMPDCVAPSALGFRLFWKGRLRRLPPVLLRVVASARLEAPVDDDYRSWASAQMGETAARAAIGLASLPTFHGDPGTLSAAFVQERIQRSIRQPAVGYVLGGWARLVAGLESRARKLGVEVVTGARVDTLPAGPCIVATDLAPAARLLGERLDWPGARTALLDVSLNPRRRDPWNVLDLDGCAYVSAYGAYDETLQPEGERLIQAASGLRNGESLHDGLDRMRALLDRAYRGWRERATWQHTGLSDAGAGAVDPPGTTWRDRPAVRRGDDVWLIGDRVAAPGVLSEVSCSSAVDAAKQALAAAARPRLARPA